MRGHTQFFTHKFRVFWVSPHLYGRFQFCTKAAGRRVTGSSASSVTRDRTWMSPGDTPVDPLRLGPESQEDTWVHREAGVRGVGGGGFHGTRGRGRCNRCGRAKPRPHPAPPPVLRKSALSTGSARPAPSSPHPRPPAPLVAPPRLLQLALKVTPPQSHRHASQSTQTTSPSFPLPGGTRAVVWPASSAPSLPSPCSVLSHPHPPHPRPPVLACPHHALSRWLTGARRS